MKTNNQNLKKALIILFKGIVLFILFAVLMRFLSKFIIPIILWSTNLTLIQGEIAALVLLVIVCFCFYIITRSKKNLIYSICLILGTCLGVGQRFGNTHFNSKFFNGLFCLNEKEIINKWGITILESHGYRVFYFFINSKTGNGFIIGMLLDDDILKFYNEKGEWLYNIKYEITSEQSYEKANDYIQSNYGNVVWWFNENRFSSEHIFADGSRIKVISKEGTIDENSIGKADSHSDSEYTDLGPIVCYKCSNKDDKEDVPLSRDYDFHLFVKTYQGENFYFIAYPGSGKIPVTKGSWTKDGEHYNGKVDLILSKGYVNISSWSSSGGSGSYNSSNNSGERTIRTESSPQPVQEWVPCPVCGNSGRLGLCQHCNGTGQDLYYNRSYRDCPNCGGLKKCTTCGGSGGHYETRYR